MSGLLLTVSPPYRIDIFCTLIQQAAAPSGDIFYRKIVQKFNVQLRPSLVVTWWDILPGGSTEECYVILDIRLETINVVFKFNIHTG